jgi:hypothetical protein
MRISPSPSTRFANLTPGKAGLLIIALILAVVYGLVVCRPLVSDAVRKNALDSDLKLYKQIVERIQAGDKYYTAAGYELRRMGFTTRSVFNWRLPPLALFLGYLPGSNTGQVLAVIIALATLFAWVNFFHMSKYSFSQTVVGSLFLAGPLIYSLLPDPFYAHEFWAGTLIALSLAAYGRGWCWLSIACGLMALFLRELALPFVCIMLVFAYVEGHRRQALVWLSGIVVFGIELFFHWSMVSKLITENDLALEGGWIIFGGWSFVLHTAQMHPFFLMTPPWVIAVVLPLALLGLAGWCGKLGTRVATTVGIYIIAYFCVGRTFNQYWGLTYAFVLPLGLLNFPFIFRDIWLSIHGKVGKREIKVL